MNTAPCTPLHETNAALENATRSAAARPGEARLAAERRAAAARRAERAEWERFVACPHLPDPRVARDMAEHLDALEAAPPPAGIADALREAEVRQGRARRRGRAARGGRLGRL
jgi:hypothetical protein